MKKMSCYIENCDNMNEEHSDFCRTHNAQIREEIANNPQVVTNARGTKFLVLPYFVKCVECCKKTDCVHLASVNDCEFLCMDCWNENYEDVYYRGGWY